MRPPPPPPKKKRRSSGSTVENVGEFNTRLKRFKDALYSRPTRTGVTVYDECKLVEEAYSLALVMSIFTKRGGPWFNSNSPGWQDRSQRAMEMMEEVWM